MADYTIPTKANLPHLGQVYSSNWDSHPIYSQIGGWIVDKDTGALKTKLHKEDWSKDILGNPSDLTGATGDVMVKIPAFYIKCTMESYGQPRWELDDTIPDRFGTNGKPGFYVHPAFLTKSGKVKPYILVGAYKGYILNNQLRSVSGVFPSTQQNITSFTDRARQGRNTGVNKHDITRFFERMAMNLLFHFEFGTLNGQNAVGKGITNVTNEEFEAGIDRKTGQTNSLGDRSGYNSAAGENGKTSVRWRGVEDFWGNVLEFVNGFMMTDTGYYFTNDVDKFLNIGAMEHFKKDLGSKMQNGYVVDMEKIPGKEWMFIPKTTGGTADTYWCDFLVARNLGAVSIPLLGGSWAGAWSSGEDSGPNCWNFSNVASYSGLDSGARLSCSEED